MFFVWLVTYSSRYSLDFSTVSAPLRKLLKSNEAFMWGPEQEEAVEKLKRLISPAEALCYVR